MNVKLSQRALFGLTALLATFAHQAHAGVVTYIDLLDQDQLVEARRSTATNTVTTTSTVASSNSIGGFRTMAVSITSTNGSTNTPTSFEVAAGTAALNSPNNHIPRYELKWGGIGGTNGLGGVDITGGTPNFTLANTLVQFSLITSDSTNNTFTWKFTDTANNVATYVSSFPENVDPNPAINYSIALTSFVGAGLVNWQSINFISLSGVGRAGYDVSFGAPFSVAAGVPEPGTWAAAGLLVLSALYVRWRRSRSTSAEEAPAAA